MKEYLVTTTKVIVEELILPLLFMSLCKWQIISEEVLPYLEILLYICLNDIPN